VAVAHCFTYENYSHIICINNSLIAINLTENVRRFQQVLCLGLQ